jgi:hypothetical protein
MLFPARVMVPPSVPPDISPSRGEIGWGMLPASSNVAAAASCTVDIGLRGPCKPISPLEGEMSGGTEGGEAWRLAIEGVA